MLRQLKFHRGLRTSFTMCATLFFIFSTASAFSQAGKLDYYRSLDTFRYFVFLKNKVEIQNRLPGIAEASPTHYNHLLLLCQAYCLLKEYSNASQALAGAICMGMDTSFITYKGKSISHYSIRKGKIDSAMQEQRLFRNRNQKLIDSQFYFLANDLRLFGNGNEESGWLQYLSKYMDTSLHTHKQLQAALVSFIMKNGWVGYKRTHRSELLLPTAHLDLENLNKINSKLTESLYRGDMLPDEFGFIAEKRFQLSKSDNSRTCKYAPAGYNCAEKWNVDIVENRRKIGMSVFFIGNSQEVFLEDLIIAR